jgi:hypothetical protein
VSNATVRGSCFCGEVRFAASLPSLFCGHCHCTMCQRSHGAGYVTWFAVSRDHFVVESGEASLSVYESSDHGWRTFCRSCGSSLFCESKRHPDQVDIVLANMEGPIDRPPEIHVFFDDRADWTVVGDGLPRLGGVTGMEPLKDKDKDKDKDEA